MMIKKRKSCCLHLRLRSGAECDSCDQENYDSFTCLSMAVDACPEQTSSCLERIKKTNKKRKMEENKKPSFSWGCSTELMMYDDPWKLKKVLNSSDVGSLSRLLLPKEMAEPLVAAVLGYDENQKEGMEVEIWDVDTQSMHSLVFKRWGSSRSYVFMANWTKDFVKRRSLKSGHEVAFHWNPYANRFHFSVLKSATEEDFSN
ncbi:hypothetical protein HN873_029570 [Arachis hypogaea]|nr:B3 domain-containing protein [Arachis hypogaea]